ncbi:ubiquitin-conjugating enzyme/RWD-like protein [Scenedesmus sp. NREL 46B-D3]|nr:ubiquitin-conjugating enzyme/RWD-like protein [Scenedesmus sp. NREL 46B-D3]
MASAQKGCVTRLQKEYKSLLREPVPHIQAHPVPSNLLEWHFVLEGAKGTDFEGGVYHGKLVFPPNYPFKPPSISMSTPNGRFAVNTKLCLSITDYHPESWNPMWSVGTILTGLLSFMYDNQPTTGSITTSKAEKQRLARESLAYNAKNATFRKLFPDWLEEHNRRAAAAAAAVAAAQQQQQQAGGGGEQQPQQLGGQQQQSSGQMQPMAQQQQQQQQQQQARAGGGGAAAGGGGGLFTFAVVAIVLAIAVVPLFSTDAAVSLSVLTRLRDSFSGSS